VSNKELTLDKTSSVTKKHIKRKPLETTPKAYMITIGAIDAQK